MKLELFKTIYKDNKINKVNEILEFNVDEGEENQLINLYPEIQYQEMEGFGGAITDAVGHVYSLMREEQKKEMIHKYFSKENMKYNMVRIPIDSCDFSVSHYEADSVEQDENFDKFSFERVETSILPVLDAAEKEYGDKLPIMLSPWSPPSYMKTNGERNNGGKLKQEYAKRWAEYICRYIEEYRKRGYLVTMLTMQNEPKAVQTWDSCVYTPQEQKVFLKEYLYPSLVSHNLDDIEIYLWDHNKERAYEWVRDIIDDETKDMVAGVALHWYSGDHFEAIRILKEQYPWLKVLTSEACIEYSKFSGVATLKNAQKYAHDIIGNINEGMSSFLDWNILLNEEGGPNHVGNNCEAPFMYDRDSKELRQMESAEYLWHFSHFIEPGAKRIGISRYCQDVEAVAFKKDNRITFILFNQTDKDIPVTVRMNEEKVAIDLSAQSIFSGVITK